MLLETLVYNIMQWRYAQYDALQHHIKIIQPIKLAHAPFVNT